MVVGIHAVLHDNIVLIQILPQLYVQNNLDKDPAVAL